MQLSVLDFLLVAGATAVVVFILWGLVLWIHGQGS